MLFFFVAQSSQLHFQEQHINDGLEDEILFGGLDGDDDVNMNGIEDLFGNDWDGKRRNCCSINETPF